MFVWMSRQCGSSQQAIHFAAQAVMSGAQDIVIAGGVESMTRVPMGLVTNGLPRKNGLGFYMSQNLTDKYKVEFSQFMGAEMMAKNYDLSLEDLTNFSVESHRRAVQATAGVCFFCWCVVLFLLWLIFFTDELFSPDGLFDNEILPLQAKIYNPKDGSLVELDEMHTVDEGMRANATFDMIHGVKPIQEGGLISAANASQICDGASGVLIVNEKGLKMLGSNVKPIARIHHMSVMGHDPVIMLEAPLPATTRALQKAGLSIDDIDVFEVNEAFAR
jgi:acetyl-CoA C-acetyltransferase